MSSTRTSQDGTAVRRGEEGMTLPNDGRLRVLLIAELANPGWVSVPLEGWCHSQALSRVADVHLVTHTRNRENIVAAGLEEGKDFTALDSFGLERTLLRMVWKMRGGENLAWTLATAFDSLLYYGFERRVFRHFGGTEAARRFDIVHRLTPLSPTAQSPMAGRWRSAGAAFVLGPLNGGLPWPPGFSAEIRKQRDWLTYARGAYRYMPAYRSTRRNAAAIVAGSRATLDQIPSWAREKVVYVPENGIVPERFDRPVDRPPSLPLRVAFVGRLVPYKGAGLLLEAAGPLLQEGRITLDIIGDGPERGSLERRATEVAGGEGRVRFPGWIPHSQLQERLRESDVLGFPSVREFGGAVVLEAMALGLVPVVVDYGGPGELVSPATGVAVPMASRDQLVLSVREVLRSFAQDPSRVRAMGQRARARALSLFTWDAKAQQMLEVWKWAVGRRTKPDFGMPLQD